MYNHSCFVEFSSALFLTHRRLYYFVASEVPEVVIGSGHWSTHAQLTLQNGHDPVQIIAQVFLHIRPNSFHALEKIKIKILFLFQSALWNRKEFLDSCISHDDFSFSIDLFEYNCITYNFEQLYVMAYKVWKKCSSETHK